MARSRTTFKRGHRGTGGRPRGARNRATLEVRALARDLVENPDYLTALRRRLVAGEAGPMETLLFRYAYGGPPEGPAAIANASGPRGDPDTAPGPALSKAGREKLLALVEGLRAHLDVDPPGATASEPAS